MNHLLLDQLEFLRLQQLLRDALGIILATETQRPELLAEFGSVFIQEPCELDLQGLDIGLDSISDKQTSRAATYESRSFEQIKAELNHHVVFISQNLRDAASDPSILFSMLLLLIVRTHFFMTSILTLFMSTFRLNSGGNLVCRSSLASTLVILTTLWGLVKGMKSVSSASK